MAQRSNPALPTCIRKMPSKAAKLISTRAQRISIQTRRSLLQQRPDTFAQTNSVSLIFSLAIRRRTIHSGLRVIRPKREVFQIVGERTREKQCPLRGSLLLQLCFPVRHQRERDSTGWGVGLQDQKTPAIGGHVEIGAIIPPVAGEMKEHSLSPRRVISSAFSSTFTASPTTRTQRSPLGSIKMGWKKSPGAEWS